MSRPPKPDTLKMLQGTARADRMNSDQPEFDVELDVTPPEYFTPMQVSIWEEVVPKLQEAHIYTTIDMSMVAALCVHLARFWEIEQALNQTQLYAIAEKGRIKCNNEAYKLVQMQHMSWKAAKEIMIKYGMSPVDRQRMKMERPQNTKIENVLPQKPMLP